MRHDPKMVASEVASAVNLMAHPAAGAVAMAALGFGLASQAVGMWVGAAEASLRLWQPLLESSASKAAGRLEPRRSASL